MTAQFTIVGVGEALYDLVGGEERLGGAPLNVAVHAQRLGRAHGVAGVVLSRIGDDRLGRLMLDDLKTRGMTVEHVQVDPDRATGKVYVRVDASGEPSYEIVERVAWDNLQWDPQMETLAQETDAVCFGSLAQRDGQSRNTIYRFVESCTHGVRLFDANLRQRFYDTRVLRRSCEIASWVKLNRAELDEVCGLLQCEGAEGLLGAFGLDGVVVTRGAEGTRLVTPSGVVDGVPAQALRGEGADAVGAGDSVSAAVLVGLVRRLPLQAVADLANRVGAYVAGQAGATPELPEVLVASG
ncbi:MAG: PfkB family carbohydrate kinase [Planctomycetota bacterium]